MNRFNKIIQKEYTLYRGGIISKLLCIILNRLVRWYYHCDIPYSLNLNNDYSKYIGYKQNGDKTGRTGSTFGACPVFERNDKKGIYYSNGERTIQAGSCERIFIRRIN